MQVELRDGQRLNAFKREIHARGHAYLISDCMLREYVLLSQRLPKACAFLNERVGDALCQASLYEAATAQSRSGLHHRRWRVRRVPLADAPQEFERERRNGYAHNVVLGSPWHVSVA